VINKQDFSIFEDLAPVIPFEENDIDLVRAMCDIIGPKIEHAFSSMINKHKAPSVDVGATPF
jgi:hypothetical protein